MRRVSVRRFDMLVFGGLIGVFLVIGGYAAWKTRGPSLEELREAAAKKNVWTWTLPDEPEPVPFRPPEVQGPPWFSAWTRPGDSITVTPNATLLLPYLDVSSGDATTGKFLTITGGGVCGVHTIPLTVRTTGDYTWMPNLTAPNAYITAPTYQPNWLVSDSFLGQGAYNPPKQMVQGVWDRVTVRIAAEGVDARDLFGRMMGSGKPESFKTKVSRVMSVKLTGETFNVKRLTDETQAMGDGPTEWQFDVQPEETGKHDLVLAVSRIVPVGELGKQPRSYPPETRSITVTINPPWATERFMTAYWQWVATSIAIPVLLWGIAKIRQREKKRKAVGFAPADPTP